MTIHSTPLKKKNAGAVALAKLRAKNMTPEARSASARTAALARAKKLSPKRRSEIARKASHSRQIMQG